MEMEKINDEYYVVKLPGGRGEIQIQDSGDCVAISITTDEEILAECEADI
tara:strand:- start:6642 stop:6791 length:150 start_codon:yes stop_codon:yes gene_type:complete